MVADLDCNPPFCSKATVVLNLKKHCDLELKEEQISLVLHSLVDRAIWEYDSSLLSLHAFETQLNTYCVLYSMQ